MTDHSPAVVPQQPLDSLTVDPIAQSFPQLHRHVETTVIGVIVHDLPHFSFNFLRFRPGPTVTIVPIVPTRLRYAQRFQATVQTVTITVLFHHLHLLVQAQLSSKKFFSNANSTSFCPSIRSSFEI